MIDLSNRAFTMTLLGATTRITGEPTRTISLTLRLRVTTRPSSGGTQGHVVETRLREGDRRLSRSRLRRSAIDGDVCAVDFSLRLLQGVFGRIEICVRHRAGDDEPATAIRSSFSFSRPRSGADPRVLACSTCV